MSTKRPVPKPRKTTQSKVKPVQCNAGLEIQATADASDEVFNDSNIEVYQNQQNELKIKSIRNKSYANALEEDELDVEIPNCDLVNTAHKPPGLALIAAAEKPLPPKPNSRPVPKPRPPPKSQPVDELLDNKDKNLKSNSSKSFIEKESNSHSGNAKINKSQSQLIPRRAAPPPPTVREKPVSDSDVPIKTGDEAALRRNSTTWYDTGQATSNSSAVEKEISSISPGVIQSPRDEVKLPTRKEKHSHYKSGLSIGSHLLDTFKSLTSKSSKIGEKIPDNNNIEESKSNRNSMFYFEIPDNLPMSKPANSGQDESDLNSCGDNLEKSDDLNRIDKSGIGECAEAPPLPPPRKRKSQGISIVESPEGMLKRNSLDLVAEINEKLIDMNINMVDGSGRSGGSEETNMVVDFKVPINNKVNDQVTDTEKKSTTACSKDNIISGCDSPQKTSHMSKVLSVPELPGDNELDVIIPPTGGGVKKSLNADSSPEPCHESYVKLKSVNSHDNCSNEQQPSLPIPIKTYKTIKEPVVKSNTVKTMGHESALNISLQSDNSDIDDLDVVIPVPGIGVSKPIGKKLSEDSPSNPLVSPKNVDNEGCVRDINVEITGKKTDASVLPMLPDLKSTRTTDKHVPCEAKYRISTTGSELDIVVHEDNSSDSDTDYNDGYVEPTYVRIDPNASVSNNEDVKNANSKCQNAITKDALPAPALPPRERSASPVKKSHLGKPLPEPVKAASDDFVNTGASSNLHTALLNPANKNVNPPCVKPDLLNIQNQNSNLCCKVGSTDLDLLNSSISSLAVCDSPPPIELPIYSGCGHNYVDKDNLNAMTAKNNDMENSTSSIDKMQMISSSSSGSSTYISASEESSNANQEERIIRHLNTEEIDINSTLKASDFICDISQSTMASFDDTLSVTSSSSEDNIYQVADDLTEDSYTILPPLHSDANISTSFSSDNSDTWINHADAPVRLRSKLRAKTPLSISSDDRPASWASFSSTSTHSDYIQMSPDSSQKSVYLSMDRLSLGSPGISLKSEMSSDEEDYDMNTKTDESDEKRQEAKRKRKQFLVAQEIMTSERTFVDILKLLNEDFRSVIGKSSQAIKAPVVPPEILSQILRHLPELQKFNEALLHDLEQRIKNWEKNPRIADIFVKKGPFLKLYTAYIMDFENKGAVLDDARKKYFEFDKCTTIFEASARCHKMSLHHFMLKPVQRLPQYRLLLNDYQKYLLPESVDYEDAKAALKIVTEVAEHANKSMSYGENINKLLEIQNSLVGRYDVIRPGRYLVKKGELTKISRKEMQPRIFFLLNDVLLYATPFTTRYATGQYRLNNAIPLTGMKVEVPNKEGYQNEFSIISTQRSFTVCAKSPEEKDEWLTVLRETIKENNDKRKSFVPNLPPKPQKIKSEAELMIQRSSKRNKTIRSDPKLGSQHPLWIPDSRVSMCMLCTGEFTLAFRRHHCRACGKVVCGFCSDYKAPLQYLENKPGRVCKDCYGKLKRGVRGSLTTKDPDKVKETKDLLAKFSKSSHGIGSKLLKVTESQMQRVSLLRESLGMGPWMKPESLKEVSATDPNALNSGYLKVFKDKKWMKRWYVLKTNVLYSFKGSEDTAATDSIVLLGYEVRPYLSMFQGVQPQLIFELIHRGLPSVMFATESPELTKKWMTLIRTASIPPE